MAITGVKDVSARENTGDISVSVDSAIDYAAEVITDGAVVYWKLAETEQAVNDAEAETEQNDKESKRVFKKLKQEKLFQFTTQASLLTELSLIPLMTEISQLIFL